MGGSIKSSMTSGVSLSPATVSVIALLSTNAAAPNALAVDGISGNCRRWKAVLLDLSPLGPRLYLPTGWSGDAGSRRLSLNADGVVVGSVEVAPAGGGSTSEVAWAWAPRTLSGYAIPAGVSRLPGLGETAEAPIESAACDLSDSGLAVGVSADSAVRWDLTSVGTPVAAFAISPPPSAASAAFGIDRAAGVTVAGMTTATCEGSGGGPGGSSSSSVARAFVGDSIALAGATLPDQLLEGSATKFRESLFGFACDGSSIWGVGHYEIPSSCSVVLSGPCQFSASRAFRWDPPNMLVQHVTGASVPSAEAIRARDANTVVGRALEADSDPQCAQRAVIWENLTWSPTSRDLQQFVPMSVGSDSSVALGVRRNLGGGRRVAGAATIASTPGIHQSFTSAVIWDECDGSWHAEFGLAPTVVQDLDSANPRVWSPQCENWSALAAYDASESGLFVGVSQQPSHRVFVATRMSDINADLVVNSLDLASLLNTWGLLSDPCSPLAEDVDANGSVGPQDLAELLNDWTIGNVTGLESFCCTDEPAPMERLELALSICGEGCVDAFIGSAVNAPLGELQARGQLISETMEAIRRATN